MKKTIIATAVSVALGAPVAAQAEVTVYGFVHNMIEVKSKGGGDSTTDMSTRGSRFGFKASSDLGNGLTASLRQEFGVQTEKKETGINTRIGTVGVSGGFGSVNVGRQWSTLYNTIGVYMDPTSTVAIGGYGGHYITNNTIQYTNSFGPVSLSLDVRMDESADEGGAMYVTKKGYPKRDAKGTVEPGLVQVGKVPANHKLSADVPGSVNGPEREMGDINPAYYETDDLGNITMTDGPDGVPDEGGDGVAVGVSIAAHPNVTLAAAMDTTSGINGTKDIEKTGFAARVSMGNFYGSYAVHDKQQEGTVDTDYSVFLLGGNFGNTNAFIGLGSTDDNAGDESDTVTLHVDHALMGSGLKLLYEGRSTDGNKPGDMGDSTHHVLGLKLAF